MTGRLFEIREFTLHDGPGVRTTVFLKGCPLRCAWCANPESQYPHPELAWTAKECIGCKNCVDNLSCYGVHFEDEGEHGVRNGLYWNEKKFSAAVKTPGAGTELKKVSLVCPTKSLHVIGEIKTVGDVISEVEKDEPFYSQSGGGITLSGGEPLLQSDFTYELLKEAGRHKIHRAIETTAFTKYETLKKIASELDYFLVDVKTWDSELHKKWTGVSNKLILENIRNLRTDFPKLPVKVRTPVIPGVNDTEQEIESIAKFVKTLGSHTEHELLKYHSLGKSKYSSLKKEYILGDAKLTEEKFAELKKVQESVLSLAPEEMRVFI